ncbi:MAG: VOC family protein [Bdellovibrio sp.]|nr:VOC family protein [Bdellovibrio sp.]
MSILDHVSINVSDLNRSRAFYDKALKPLGITQVMEYKHHTGYGKGGKPDFWTAAGQNDFQTAEQIQVITPAHICFKAGSRAEVDAFYKSAMEAGAKDNGAPGLRPHYSPNYYGAFVIDPDGHNIEAVYHGN